MTRTGLGASGGRHTLAIVHGLAMAVGDGYSRETTEGQPGRGSRARTAVGLDVAGDASAAVVEVEVAAAAAWRAQGQGLH